MSGPARPGVRIAAFAAGLAVIFGVMFGVGQAVGPWDQDPQPTHGHSTEHDQGGGH